MNLTALLSCHELYIIRRLMLPPPGMSESNHPSYKGYLADGDLTSLLNPIFSLRLRYSNAPGEKSNDNRAACRRQIFPKR
jgi:hypothetical protein